MNIETNSIQIHKTPSFFKLAFGIGILNMLISIGVGLCCSKEQFFFSALTAGTFALGIPLGALFFVLIHYLAGARWSVTTRRIAEVMASITPWMMILLAAVVLLGMHHLYEWTNPNVVAVDELLQKKQKYLNVPFFVVRLAIYFIVWTLLTRFLLKTSVKEDQSSSEATNGSAKAWSPIGIILFALTVTFAAFDMLMSLDPHWYSTIFGVYIFAGYVVSFFAAIILICLVLQRNGYLKNIVTIEHYHDLGTLMFAFTCFWAFCAFSQYMLIWYGNIPEETVFFSHRWAGAWKYASLALPITHFAVPFILLMSRPTKRNLKFLSFMCVWLLLAHFLDLHWLVLPNLHHEGFHFSLLDVTTLIGFTGIFLGILGKKLSQQALIPINDPYLETSLHHKSR